MRWKAKTGTARRRLRNLAVAFGCLMSVGHALAVDPHVLYETACAKCHAPHAAAFFRERLGLDEGAVMVRRTGEDFEGFLSGGHGALPVGNVPALMDLAARVVRTPALFQNKCRICHEPAVDLARGELIVRAGRLVGRYSGRDTAAFLSVHGRLAQTESDQILSMLRWQLETWDGYRTNGTDR